MVRQISVGEGKYIYIQRCGWIRNGVLSPVLFCLCVILATYIGNATLYLAMAIVIYQVVVRPPEDSFYFSFFLIPNIRMLDGIGITFCVNILMVLPLVKYLYVMDFKVRKQVAFCVAILFILVMGHTLVQFRFDIIVSQISWLMSFMCCCSMTTDKKMHIKKEKVAAYLTGGVIASAITYFICNPLMLQSLQQKIFAGQRLEAYASDPNYYSLYICLSMVMLLNVEMKNYMRFILISVLTMIGFMTASKMCFLMMLIVLVSPVYLYIYSGRIRKKNLRFIVVFYLALCVVLILFREMIWVFIENLLVRANLLGGGFDLNSITTGRYDIVQQYLQGLFDNPQGLFLGYGFSYRDYFPEATNVSHNTFLDIILCFGVVGGVIVILLCYTWLKKMHIQMDENHKKINFAILAVLGLGYMALSCVTATMFWWILCAAMLYWYNDVSTH